MAENEGAGTGALGNVTDMASRAADTARQKVSDATDAVRNMSTDDAARMARQGGEYAYDTVASHPFATAAIGALVAYALFRPSRSSDYDFRPQYRQARDMASDYADQARSRFGDYDFSGAYDMGRDYANRLSSQASKEPLAAAVGGGLVACLLMALMRK